MDRIAWIERPAPTADVTLRTWHGPTAIVLTLAGVGLVAVAAAVQFASTGLDPGAGTSTRNAAWTFATNTFGLGIIKTAIAVVLISILIALWHRVHAVGVALPQLRSSPRTDSQRDAEHEPPEEVVLSTGAPRPLSIHRVAERAWLPTLLMGALALAAGLVLGLGAAAAVPGSTPFRSFAAWGQGTLFLGEGLVLSGIALLSGSVLSALRRGGGEVQERLGVPVQTLTMPTSGRAFIGLMMAGMVASMAQFAGYALAASIADDPVRYGVLTAWLGPVREVALGVLLVGIVFALATIARVLHVQFDRIRALSTHTA
jgi:uncharacterized membrane protein